MIKMTMPHLKHIDRSPNYVDFRLTYLNLDLILNWNTQPATSKAYCVVWEGFLVCIYIDS